MKTDLTTAIITTIIGFLLAFFVTNIFTGEITPFSYKTIDETINIDLVEPDPEIFNYRALNPTVEVYIGSCVEYGADGECAEVLVDGTKQDQSTDQENS